MSLQLPVRAAAVPGFSLVEVTLALGITVFCLVVVLGLMNVGINTSSASIEQTTATSILAAVASDLRAAPTPSGNTPGAPSLVYGLTLPVNSGSDPAGPTTKLLDSSGRPNGTPSHYQLDVWMKRGVNRGATLTRIMVSWPPNAAVKSGSVEMLVALDRN